METKITRDLNRLKQDSSASVREVRDFVGRMRGKSPQDVLGMVAQSSLVSGVTIAATATIVLIMLFTVGPYLFRDESQPEKPTPATAQTKPVNEAAPAPGPTPPSSESPTKVAPPTSEATPDRAILKKLEMDEVKQADPDANPLEGKDDDLLKELR